MISHFSLGPPDPELQAFIGTRVPNTTKSLLFSQFILHPIMGPCDLCPAFDHMTTQQPCFSSSPITGVLCGALNLCTASGW